MPLERDLSDLPTDAPESNGEGWTPDAEPRFGRLLIDAWHAEDVERDAHFRDGQTARFFHSNAGSCSRAIAYSALGVPQSNLPTAADHFVMRLGRMTHEDWQAFFLAYFDQLGAVEVRVVEGDRAGTIDAVLFDKDGRALVALEVKTVDGYSYKLAVGEQRGPALGPKFDHIIQAALGARALNAGEAVILYFARGAVSKGQAKRSKIDDYRRVMAEWTLTRAQYEPIADQEIERITAILGLVDAGVLPARKIPDPELPLTAVITDPTRGVWMAHDGDRLLDTGSYWGCEYCRWLDTCAQTEPGRTSTEVLVQIGVLS